VGRSRFTLILLILTSITLITLDFRGFGPIDSARGAVLSAFSPVGEGAAAIFRPVGNLWHGAFEYDDLKRQNEDLQAQVDQLNGRVADDDVYKSTNQELLALLKLQSQSDLPTVPARVVSGAVANFDNTIELDKGSNDGIKKDMPVRSGTGLVGTVVQVSSDRSVVRLITDTSYQVGVTVVGSLSGGGGPVVGVAKGQGPGRQLKATVDVSADVKPGQILVTAGVAGGLFPPDVPVGTIADVSTDAGALQKTLDVDLLANLRTLTYVTVLLWEPSS
jgi:rod shape-determining protein MreC